MNIIITPFNEDLKDDKIFKRYSKISFAIGLIGVIMVLTDWNHLCGLEPVVITFSLFINIHIIKLIMNLSFKLTKKEGFFYSRGNLEDGIYTKNNGNLNEVGYYKRYSFFLIAIPSLLILTLLILAREFLC
ncbi:MAG: hypothetical protein HKP48_11165 [Winogradskyella sp.]|uniref:hypothetical protein n=1 Tax=Winogradskyella sp. TaxID=1883156 RepID=UPI0017FE40E3|nr:hypothetical protein [Winogradskyella sp.]MBT8244818.1 hypothetical protein [Winogradskyella sp.]NNK23820.1 hypothetical protein [Winogradskyella sp.]